jgi:hypothetical protein
MFDFIFLAGKRDAKPWVGAPEHYSIVNWSTTKNKLCRVQWSLNALRSKETFDNVIFTDETSVEIGADGKLFFLQDNFRFGFFAG